MNILIRVTLEILRITDTDVAAIPIDTDKYISETVHIQTATSRDMTRMTESKSFPKHFTRPF